MNGREVKAQLRDIHARLTGTVALIEMALLSIPDEKQKMAPSFDQTMPMLGTSVKLVAESIDMLLEHWT